MHFEIHQTEDHHREEHELKISRCNGENSWLKNENAIEVSLAAELKVILFGSLILFTKRVHWEAK